MKELKGTPRKGEGCEAATKHLLNTRARQVKALQKDIAGYEETVRLCAAFIGQLSVALMGGDRSSCGVTGVRREDGIFALSISRQALADAIGKWQLRIEKEEAAYRVLIEEKKQEN